MYLIIVNLPFNDWKNYIVHKNILFGNKIYKKNNYYLLPLGMKDYIKFNNIPKNIFPNNLDNIYILENKSKFAKFTLEKYPENIH